MAEGILYKPVTDENLNEQLVTAAKDFLESNGDGDIKIIDSQIVYSNVSGYRYEVTFQANLLEEGILRITVDDNNAFKVTEES